MKILDRPVGIELEFSSKFKYVQSLITPYFNKNEIHIEDSVMQSTNKNIWYLKGENHFQTELTTPVITLQSPENRLLKKILNILEKNNVRITKSDGIHFHIDVPDCSKENLFIAWLSIEPIIKDMFPYHRIKHSKLICDASEPYTPSKIPNMFKPADIYLHELPIIDSHSKSLSFQNYDSNKTIEFRLLEGSINYNDMRNWLRFCLYFIEYAKKIDPITTLCSPINNESIYSLHKLLDIKSPSLIDWIYDRYKKFKK